MDTSDASKGQYLLAIDPLPPPKEPSKGEPQFQAYFVGSTAPNNVEKGVEDVNNPQPCIKKIAEFFTDSNNEKEQEILIVVHGYNTGLGDYSPNSKGVRGWYESIRDHISENFDIESKKLVLLGYRWSSEVIKGKDDDSLGAKVGYAVKSLPEVLKILFVIGLIGALSSSVFLAVKLFSLPVLQILFVSILILSLITVSAILTLFLLRLSGYFRDSYRATNFGVPDLVELIRHLDKQIFDTTLGEDRAIRESYWNEGERRIKLSFIGHSMGGFVVTNTVRILSDVFDRESIGSLEMGKNNKQSSSPLIGNVFSLGRLVLVSPDIPAETIISGRANFLSSSLHRFEEAYLFSNEGDMALRLASTAANYFSFPAKTRAGGYRLGNVTVKHSGCGIVNLNTFGASFNEQQRLPLLESLFVSPEISLSERQKEILGKGQKPIAELFTYFDCTDYKEYAPSRANAPGHKVGIVSLALGKPSLNLWDYTVLAFDYATDKIDTHGGYFYNGDRNRPEAKFTKHLIYGLACLGFQHFLESLPSDPYLSSEPAFEEFRDRLSSQEDSKMIALQTFSSLCKDKGIEVLLSPIRYSRDVLQTSEEDDL